MSSKKIAENLVKHELISNDSILGIISVKDNLSISLDKPIVEYEPFKNYFRSDFFMLILTECGEATININLNEYQVKQYDFIISPPFDIKKYVASTDCKLSIVSFTSNFLESIQLINKADDVLNYFTSQFSPIWTLEKKDYSIIKNAMKDIALKEENMLGHTYGKELLDLTFTSFLYQISALASKYAQPINKSISRKEHLVLNFTTLVKVNFKKERGLQFYAEQLNITSKYLTETVKEISGKTASEIIESFVIQEAKMLLDNPALSISEIAYELNFSDQSFFGKFFKRITGGSPKEYRTSF